MEPEGSSPHSQVPAATFHICRLFLHPQTEDAPYHGDSDPPLTGWNDTDSVKRRTEDAPYRGDSDPPLTGWNDTDSVKRRTRTIICPSAATMSTTNPTWRGLVWD